MRHIKDHKEVIPMKKLLAVCMVLAMLFTVTGALAAAPANRLDKIKADGKLIVATSPDYAPYEFVDKDGNMVGADLELAKFIAAELGVELEMQAMDFDTVLASITTGKVDLAIAGLTLTEERKEFMDFTDSYYSDGSQIILILKENAETLKTLADFKGKTVAAQNGSLQFKLATEQLTESKIEPITKIPDAVLMLKTNKVDGIALADVVANQFIANDPDVVICATPFDHVPEGVVGAVVKGETELLAAVNAAIKKVLDEGMYDKWISDANELNSSLIK
jgi:polar amino acid transport system substrate-binding protein